MLKINDYAYISPLKDVHPTEKVVFALSALLFTILTKNLIIASITFATMSTGIVLGAKVPLYRYTRLLLLPSFFLLSSIIAILFSVAPIDSESINALWKFQTDSWQIYVSSYSINEAIHIVFTVLASVSCLYFIILTTPLNHLIWLLQKAHLPTLFIELAGFTYRFIFVLLEKIQEIYIAQSSRLGYQNYRIWLASLGALIVSLFIKSIRTTRDLQIAIDSRGGDEGLYEVELNIKYKQFHWAGIIFFIVVLLTISIS